MRREDMKSLKRGDQLTIRQGLMLYGLLNDLRGTEIPRNYLDDRQPGFGVFLEHLKGHGSALCLVGHEGTIALYSWYELDRASTLFEHLVDDSDW